MAKPRGLGSMLFNRPTSASSARSDRSHTVPPSPPRPGPGPAEDNSANSGCEEHSPATPSRSRGLTNVGHPAFTDIGKKLHEYNDALGDIQHLGISHVADLPELVLVGDQSSGKSTLMSALAQLELPTSSGICTRCPFHIRMSSSKDSRWSCTVSLQQEYEYKPPTNREIRRSDVTKRNPFPPWTPKSTTETILFKTIYENDSTGIDEILRWAQIATLNPSQQPEQFVPGEGRYAQDVDIEIAKRATEAKFSPNIVALEIRGPCLPGLSFLDLPGIFAISEAKSDDYLVDVVENLTRKYVGREGAMVMVALPMDLDIDNAKTLRIIRELNAESRTIGVLTKADRPDFNMPDTIAYWLAVLDERKQKVKKDGFYVTSLPPAEGPNNFAAWEELFFRAKVKNWPDDFDRFVSRCGVDQLRVHITKELGNAFAHSLPNIKHHFDKRFQEIQGCLAELPDLPRNVEHEVRTSLRSFYSAAKLAVNSPQFENGCKELTDRFHLSLLGLKPRYNLITENRNPKGYDTILISDDSEDEPAGSKRSAPRVSTNGSTPKRQRCTELFTTPVKAESSPAPVVFWSPAKPMPSSPQKSQSLLEVQEEIKRKTRGGFGEVVPFEVYETLCLRAISPWEKPLGVYADSTTLMLKGAVIEAFESSLKPFSNRLIYRESYRRLVAFLEEQGTHQRERLFELFENETYKVATINEEGLNIFKAKEKSILEAHRFLARAKAAGLVDEDVEFSRDEQISQEERDKRVALMKKHRENLADDKFEREIDVLAKVRGYYLTAAMRFVDCVSMDINSRLFRYIRNGGLDDFLDRELGLFPYPSPEVYSKLMEEDVVTAEKREQLRIEQEKLSIAMTRISMLENSLVSISMTGEDSDRKTEK